MSDSNPLPSPPLAEQQTIDTIPPTPPHATAPEEFFDSKGSLDVKQYLASSTGRFQRPRKPTRKSTKQDVPPSPSTVDTGATSTTARGTSTSSRPGNEDDNVTASQSPALSQDPSEHDGSVTSEPLSSSQDGGRFNGGFADCKMCPRSNLIKVSAVTSPTELQAELVTAVADKQRLQERINKLQEDSDLHETEKAELRDEIEDMEAAKNAVMGDEKHAQEALKDMEKHSDEVFKTNERLEQLNKDLARQISQAKISKRNCELLNATQANQMQELREEVFRKTNSLKQFKEQWRKLAEDRAVAAEESQKLSQKLAQSENSKKPLKKNISALEADLKAVRNQIEEQEAELEATRIRIVHSEQQQVSLEDECFQYDGAETTTPSYGSPAHSPKRSNTHSRRPERRMAEDQTLQEVRLSDTPALTDDASTRSTASLASPPPIASPQPIDSAGPSDLPNTDHEFMSSSDPLDRSADRQHKIFHPWHSEREGTLYTIPGPRPRHFTDVTEEVKMEAPVSTNDAGTQTSELRGDAPPTSTNDAGIQTSAPPVAASSLPSLPSPVAVRGRRHWWHHVALGTSIFLFLVGHAVFVERRIWGGANELSRHAVVSMRDEWWGSPWVERAGYALDQTLAVDRTGFC